jgi:FKBP-type peptidyl-prolyl cis-trans isomerase SlyD
MPPQQIEDGVVVTLQYRLTLDDDEIVEESVPDDPLMYLHGYDSIITGLERQLTGLKVGDKKEVIVEPADAYGDYDDEDVDSLPREEFPIEFELVPGMLLEVEDEEGHVLIATVTDFDENTIELDYNHPLAGERLHFDVEVLGLREATPIELEHGHVHGAHGHHDH